MNISFYDYGSNVPHKKRYERGIDYLLHEFDLGFDDTFYLVGQLKNNRSSISIFAPGAMVEFYIYDNELNVQIDGNASGFWHGSNLDMPTARAILKAASDGCEDFGVQVSGTQREWDVY